MATHGPEALFGGFRGADGSRLRKMMDSSSSQRPVRPHRKRGVWAERVVVIDEAHEKFACSDEEEDDDCKITGCWLAPKRRQSKRVGAKRPVKWNSAVSDHTSSTTAPAAAAAAAAATTTTTVDLSDCEVEIGAHSDIRKRWEEAAVKRKKFQPFSSGKGSSVGKADGGAQFSRDDSASTSKCNMNESEDGHAESMFCGQERPNLEPEFFVSASLFKEHKFAGRHATKQGDANGTCQEPNSSSKNLFKEHSKEELRRWQSSFSNGFGDTRRTPPLKKNYGSNSGSGKQSPVENCTLSRDFVADGEFIADREKVKESDEFKKADEEEWQRRQEELQKQAQEAQRLKKRKKAEAERQLAMENRQRQRVEQVRENQIQEMKNNGIKELIRGQIQHELERKVAGCMDMATLLHRLGIPVEGGVQCTAEQVNGAYKKAILRFHPDRAAATSNNDPRRQVEAEETFKLITKMKTTLHLVPLPLKPRSARK